MNSLSVFHRPLEHDARREREAGGGEEGQELWLVPGHLRAELPGAETLPEVLEFMANFGEKQLGKGVVWAKETPNFVGNRIGVDDERHKLRAIAETARAVWGAPR